MADEKKDDKKRSLRDFTFEKATEKRNTLRLNRKKPAGEDRPAPEQTPPPSSLRPAPPSMGESTYVPPVVPGADRDLASSAIRRMEQKKRREGREQADDTRHAGSWLTNIPKPVQGKGKKRPAATPREMPTPRTGPLFDPSASALEPPNIKQISLDPKPAEEYPEPVDRGGDFDLADLAKPQSAESPAQTPREPGGGQPPAAHPEPPGPAASEVDPPPAQQPPQARVPPQRMSAVNLRLRPPAGISPKPPGPPHPPEAAFEGTDAASPSLLPAHEFVPPPPKADSDEETADAVQSAALDTVAREHERVGLKLEIPLRFAFEAPVVEKPDDLPLVGTLLDISQGGCQFQGPLPSLVDVTDLTQGAYVAWIQLKLPYVDSEIELRGKVRRAAPLDKTTCVFGVQFEHVSEHVETVLQQFMISYSMRKGMSR